jgi:hypothetical protein
MKFSNTRLLGIIAIIGSPWMFIDFINNGLYDRFNATSISGIRNSIFMIGWICSVLGLYQLHAMGNKRWQKNIIITQLIFLFLALCWSVFEIFAPNSSSPIFYYLNFSWPLAGFLMIVTGIVIIRAKKLKGWKRYMPLLAGFWFPQTVLIYLIDPNSFTWLVISGIYATVVFSLLGFVLAISEHETSMKNKALYKS